MLKTLTTPPIFARERSYFKTVSVKNINVNVLFGEPERLLVDEITKNLPFSKILFLQNTNLFFSSGLKLIERLKRSGIEVISVLIDENDLLSLESVCGIFRASEEVRGVVALGEKAFEVAKYYSSVSGARFFAVANSFLPFDFFNPKLYIKNGKMVDSVSVPTTQTIVIDENSFFNSDISLLVGSFLAEGYFSLVDAKLSGELLDEWYERLKKEFFHLVDLSFLSNADNFSNDAQKLFRLFIDYAENFYNRLSGRAFNSCIRSVLFLYYGGFRRDHSLSVRTALKIFSVIENFMENPVTLEPCDFRKRVEEVKSMVGLEENAILTSLVFQQRFLYGKNFQDFFSDSVELWKLKKILASSMKESSYDEQKFSLAVKHCGDTTLNINVASLLRHLGALEKV